MLFTILFVVSWFYAGYVAARMIVYFNRADDRKDITWWNWIAIPFGYISWFIMMTCPFVSLSERRVAHFIPRLRVPVPRISQDLQRKVFLMKGDN